ncbi:uncharacterized protein [Ptychodera flava]|uniref:uncharacterized protein n=1 Tax=Ptychodera flava TaxID=63121 RepID=UPI00396AAFD4
MAKRRYEDVTSVGNYARGTHRSEFRFIREFDLVNDVFRRDKAHFHFTVDFRRLGYGKDLSLQLAINVENTARNLRIEVQKGHSDDNDKGNILLMFLDIRPETLRDGWMVTDLSDEMGMLRCDQATDVNITIYVSDGDISKNTTLICAGKMVVIERIEKNDEALCACRTSRPVTIQTSSAFPKRFGKVVDPLTFNTSFCYSVGKSGDSEKDCNDQLANRCLPIVREDLKANFDSGRKSFWVVFPGAIVKRCGFHETHFLAP